VISWKLETLVILLSKEITHCKDCTYTGYYNTQKRRYEDVSKSFRTGRLERELHMVQLCATRCSCIAILWVSLVSFASITLCIASQWAFINVYFVIGLVRKLLDTPSRVYGHGLKDHPLSAVCDYFLDTFSTTLRTAEELFMVTFLYFEGSSGLWVVGLAEQFGTPMKQTTCDTRRAMCLYRRVVCGLCVKHWSEWCQWRNVIWRH